MSSMRNAVQRRNHKERAQPLERQKWGLLEKHKDYSLRAADHKSKTKRLKALKQKAAERNPDEFAFGMMSSATKGGVKISKRGAENGTAGPMSVEAAKLFKTQDAGYLRMTLQEVKKDRSMLEEEIVMARVHPSEARHTFGARSQFFDDGGAIIIKPPPVEEYEEDERLSKPELEDFDTVEEYREARRKYQAVTTRYKMRDILQTRERDLSAALDALESQRAKMANTVGGINKNGVKFKVRERKR